VDKNLVALLHTSTALLFALVSTHPNPNALNEAFSFYLEEANQQLPEASEAPALIAAWANTFRNHFAKSG